MSMPSENPQVSGLKSALGQVPADDYPLDLVGALEDLHHHRPWGSFRRSTACTTPWYQHGFPGGFPVDGRRAARRASSNTVRARSKEAGTRCTSRGWSFQVNKLAVSALPTMLNEFCWGMGAAGIRQAW
jgi:hypothetical protein